jgi:hypothetical protein
MGAFVYGTTRPLGPNPQGRGGGDVSWAGPAAAAGFGSSSGALSGGAVDGTVAAVLQAAAEGLVPYPPPATEAFAEAAGIELFLPGHDTVAVGYHEAGNTRGLELTPFGRMIRNENRTKLAPVERSPGPGYIVMSSRGRRREATSAVDMALRPGTPVRSPVSGVVGEVDRYLLYEAYPDVKVTLIPLGRPDLRVVIIHVAKAHLRPGQRVVAGLTRIGIPRQLPFRSQVNDYVGPGIPHVHIEVKRIVPSGHQAPL